MNITIAPIWIFRLIKNLTDIQQSCLIPILKKFLNILYNAYNKDAYVIYAKCSNTYRSPLWI